MISHEGVDGSSPKSVTLSKIDELIRYSRYWGQRSRSYGVIYKKVVSSIPCKGDEGSSPNLTYSMARIG